jgi:L-ascorbate metabolism protein UlaG (beta-lactamase superfamily)
VSLSLIYAALLAVVIVQPVGPASGLPAESPEILLAQAEEEGDIDQSYDSYGQDIDEEIEYDEALVAPADTATKVMPVWPYAEIRRLLRGVMWLGHASFLIQDQRTVYIDPYDLPTGLPPADLVLITHDHSDHLSPKDIQKIIGDSTIVVSIEAVKDRLPEAVRYFRAVRPGDTLTIQDMEIDIFPAYNVDKKFHPKKAGYVGFVIHTGGRAVYHAGDTDLIPEMKKVKTDVALLPVGGKFTMDAIQAAEAAQLIKPKVAVPMHWGKIVGSEEDAKVFETKAGVPVVILEVHKPEKSPQKN